MRKRLLALLLGGTMVCGLFLQAPAAVQANGEDEDPDDLVSQDWQEWKKDFDCDGLSDAHITSSSVNVVNGALTVTVEVQTASPYADWGGAIYVSEEKWMPTEGVGDGTKEYYNFISYVGDGWETMGYLTEDADVCDKSGSKGSFTHIFEELTAGKTYYVYCQVWDPHNTPEAIFGSHYAVCLGSGTPTAGSAGTPSENTPSEGNKPSDNVPSGAAPSGGAPSDPAKTAEAAMISQIKLAEAGSTVALDKGTTTLPNSVMKELLKKGDVALRLEFAYGGQDYVIVIPAGAAVDNDIPWYGPLYLAQQYGNSAAGTSGAVYEVKSGDRLGKIAAANSMTLKQLLEKNPQIKDANKIRVGQKINL